MNERIKELAEQATTIEYGADRGFDRVTFDKEKFAELIVRECVGILEKEIASKSETVIYNQDEWDKQNLHFTLLTNMVLETKEHFGVKE